MSGPQYSAQELLARLVSFDTTSHKTNLPLIRFVEDYLAQHGLASTLIPDETGEKASLFATIGEARDGGVGLSGHTDVVPVTGQDWQSDPFTLTTKGERLFGRGSTDMKGFLACALAAVPDFKSRALSQPIHIIFSYDEETGCTGVRPLIAELGTLLPRPAKVIVGEPTSMGVVDAHKGPVRWQADVAGRAAHSSMAPLGVNAISYASRLLNELSEIEQDLMRAPRDERFDPGHSTLQVTEIDGGTASNIVPVSCSFGFEVRALPGLDIEAIENRIATFIEANCLEEMRLVAPEAGITVRQTNTVPPFQAQPGSDAVALALSLTGRNEPFAVSYATEAGLFQDGGAPAVVCGPGDIAQAHTANEWISVEQLEACSAFMVRLADWAEK